MHIKFKTRIRVTPEEFWEALTEPVSLAYVTKPIMHVDLSEDMDQPWKEGESYVLPMRALGVLPAMEQSMTIKKMDPGQYSITTDESGPTARVWIHTMSIVSDGKGWSEYRDHLYIEAGLKTPFLWLFCQVFYRHRQRRWKKLLQA